MGLNPDGRFVRRAAVFGAALALWALLPSCSAGGTAATGAFSSGSTDAASSAPAAMQDASATTPSSVEAGGRADSATPRASDAATNSSGTDAGCAAGTTLCGSACTNLTSDSVNCGGCGARCPTGQVCQNGACGCRTGQTLCSGACVDTPSDSKNCGACGTACGAGMVCSVGKCASGCGSLTQCGTSCVDTSGDSLNCGACSKACPSDQFCFAGACQCVAGEGPCGTNNQCVDITTNVAHCGSCSTVCPSGGSCIPHPPSSPSTCACPAGAIACGGACIDPNTDPNNCGACATKCSVAGTQCLSGGCVNPSSVNCGGGAMVGNTCVANQFVLMGKYWVNNNQWGVSGTGTSGQQCVWGTCETGDLVGWGTSWDWTGGKSGVKTFASLVFGWQFGIKIPKAQTGLPVQISANNQVNCGWDFTVSQTGTIDISFDTWLHTVDVSAPGNNNGASINPSEEVMIWLYEAGGAGPVSATGSPVASGISLANTTWNLYQGNNGSWPVSSYVRTGNATTVVMNMMVFYSDLVTRGWIPGTRYLSSLQPGTEVFTGSGSLTTNGFYCRVQ